MLTITKQQGEYVAKCGKGECVLPVVERIDPESQETLTEVLSPSGIRGLARIAVDVTYTRKRVKEPDGAIVTVHVPHARIYSDVGELLTKLALDRFPGALTRISRIRDSATAGRQLAKIMSRTANYLWKQGWNWEGTASFEACANSRQAIVLEGKAPTVDGRFAAEMEAMRKLDAGRALRKAGLLHNLCATSVGSPGDSYYLEAARGHSTTELANPLIHEAPSKRLAVVNAVKNAVDIVGAQPSPVSIQGVNRTPPMTNAVVVCMPFAGDDSVIISESLARRLTAKTARYNWHNLDKLINYRGGLRPTGRNAGLVKRAAEWPLRLNRTEMPGGHVVFTPRQQECNAARTSVTNPDAELLRALRAGYESKWQGMIAKLGAYSAEESRCWGKWLSKHPRWRERHAKQPMRRRFGFGVERVELNGAFLYRESLGVCYGEPEVGMKLQSDGDLFKGVVSTILPDEKMPLVRLAGKLVRAEVVCEMARSSAKHGSLRFAHGQIALYAVARHLGGLGIVGHPRVEEIGRLAVETGVYETSELTCEVFDSTGKLSYGFFPAGVTRVCRHRQDPSVVSAVKGHAVDVSWRELNSVKSGGCVNGLVDTYCMLAAGLTECARELRLDIPLGRMMRIELLRNALR